MMTKPEIELAREALRIHRDQMRATSKHSSPAKARQLSVKISRSLTLDGKLADLEAAAPAFLPTRSEIQDRR